jgi:hypothetical protein
MSKIARRKNGRPRNGDKTPRRKKGLGRFNLVEQANEIERIFQQAVEHELSIHKRLGNPVAAWRDGKLVIIPPEEIVLSSES